MQLLKCMPRPTVLFMMAALFATSCEVSNNDSNNDSDSNVPDQDTAERVSESRTYSGWLRDNSVTYTALFGQGAWTSCGESHTVPFTITLKPDGTLTISSKVIVTAARFYNDGSVRDDCQYTGADLAQTINGTYSSGSFDFNANNTHYTGTYSLSLLRGTGFVDTRTSIETGQGDVAFSANLSFEGTR